MGTDLAKSQSEEIRNNIYAILKIPQTVQQYALPSSDKPFTDATD